jgi:hypothetical protein
MQDRDRVLAIHALADLVPNPSERKELFNMKQLLIEAIKAFPDGATVQQIQLYIRHTWRTDFTMRELTTNLSAMRKAGMLYRRGRIWILAK